MTLLLNLSYAAKAWKTERQIRKRSNKIGSRKKLALEIVCETIGSMSTMTTLARAERKNFCTSGECAAGLRDGLAFS